MKTQINSNIHQRIMFDPLFDEKNFRSNPDIWDPFSNLLLSWIFFQKKKNEKKSVTKIGSLKMNDPKFEFIRFIVRKFIICIYALL